MLMHAFNAYDQVPIPFTQLVVFYVIVYATYICWTINHLGLSVIRPTNHNCIESLCKVSIGSKYCNFCDYIDIR